MEDKSGCVIMILVAALLALLLFLSKMENERNAESMGFSRNFQYFPETATVDMTFEQQMPLEIQMKRGEPVVIRFFRDVNTMANVVVSLLNLAEQETLHISVKALDGLARPVGDGACDLEEWERPSHASVPMRDWCLFATSQLLADGRRVVHLAAFNALPTEEELAKLQDVPENIARIENKFWATRLVLP